MMLTKKEADWIRVLIKQVPHDVAYMRPHTRDHHSYFTLGHCERYEDMGRWLARLLEVYERAQAADAVDPIAASTAETPAPPVEHKEK